MANKNENREVNQIVRVRKKLVELIHHPAASRETKEKLSKVVKLLIKE